MPLNMLIYGFEMPIQTSSGAFVPVSHIDRHSNVSSTAVLQKYLNQTQSNRLISSYKLSCINLISPIISKPSWWLRTEAMWLYPNIELLCRQTLQPFTSTITQSSSSSNLSLPATLLFFPSKRVSLSFFSLACNSCMNSPISNAIVASR
jgi:hypothetical protein